MSFTHFIADDVGAGFFDILFLDVASAGINVRKYTAMISLLFHA